MSLTHLDFNRTPAFTPHHLWDRIAAIVTEFRTGLRAERQHADLRRQLDGLDDHLLRDIGLDPKDVRSPVITGYEGIGLETRRR